MLNYRQVLERHSVQPQGVIHVGAHAGDEQEEYAAIGFKNQLFIEAQPDTYFRLEQRLLPTGAFTENYAASNQNSTAKFHITNNGQSSSLLELKEHARIYPSIEKTQSVDVSTIRIDDLLSRPKYNGVAFNFMNMDIQGAEFLALAGSCRTLERIDMLNLEVNLDELYKGAPHILQLDNFLLAFDFVRIDTVLIHKTWGDAIYIKQKFTKSQC